MTSNFSKSIDAFVAKANASLLDVLRQTVVESFSRVIDRTPIDILPDADKAEAKAAVQDYAAKLQMGDEARFIASDPKVIEAEFGNATRLPAAMFRLTALEWNEIVAEIVARIKKAKE